MTTQSKTDRLTFSTLLDGANWSDAARECIARGIDSFWLGRIEGMTEYAASAGLKAAGCTRIHAAFTGVKVTRRSWPVSGSIILDRADGTRWKLSMEKKRCGEFRVDQIS